MSNAIVLHGEASRRGARIVLVGPDEFSDTGTRLAEGEHIQTHIECINYTLFSGTTEARAAVVDVLNARTSEQLGAVTSQYGHLSCVENRNHGNYVTVPVAFIRRCADDLRKLDEELRKPGGFSKLNPPPIGLAWHPFAMKFGLWLLTDEDHPRGFRPVLETPDIYGFLAQEITTIAFSGHPLLFCSQCMELRREPARRDCQYCGDVCRQKAHRQQKRLAALAAVGT